MATSDLASSQSLRAAGPRDSSAEFLPRSSHAPGDRATAEVIRGLDARLGETQRNERVRELVADLLGHFGYQRTARALRDLRERPEEES